MSPSDATFDIPVTVTMPHCGIFTKPETAKVVTYYRKSASESFTALLSTGGSPQCVVRHRDLDIYMNHFSEIWIVAIIRRTFIGKRVICTPYIPVSTPKNDEHVLFVHVRDENIGKGEVQPGYMAPITGEQFLVRWRSGALKITCPESTMKDKAMTLRGSELRHLTQHKVMFKVDTRTADKNKVILQFILKQSTTKQLLVPMHLEVNAGADMKKEAKNGVASLNRASYSGHVDIVKYLISQGANSNSVDNEGADVNKAAKDSVASLDRASYTGHVDIVKYLISKGANPNSVDNDGITPLHVASQEGHLDVVECLVNEGADVKKVANNGMTVLNVALERGRVDITLKGVTPLMAAARGGHLDCVRLLLENNADIETVDAEGWTSVHYAAAR
ncbi:ankyrin-3-like [Strongylocentrotus purpuratus]|uniref:Uncharacterized protein n=1 Tax=Strongylocentrotus purpuratus TaxID=7668 RepID=A0A7M7PFJ5_STRPU|nr:ankyrin-3-like [Strongylocentrotus purpuratus]